MIQLDLAYFALCATLAALAAATICSIHFEAVPALSHRAALRSLRRAVQHEADEHAAKPEPRRRHDAHCPACGRFAQLVSDGPRGRWTRCRAHGVQARRVKRIGKHETTLVRLSFVPDQRVHIAPPLVEHIEAMRPTYRLEDALDLIVRGLPVRPLGRLAA